MSSADRCELLCLDLIVAERLRKNRLSSDHAEAAAGKARALADPTRLTLAAALLEEIELCVCDLAWIAERSQTLVSHHMRVLRTHGIVGSRRDGKMVMYSLTDEGRTLLASVLAVAGPATTRLQGVDA
jgi:DNA-binding transcriptional ArsR family regulator